MPKSLEDYTNANRRAWNEAAPRHAAHNNEALFEAFKKPDHVTVAAQYGSRALRWRRRRSGSRDSIAIPGYKHAGSFLQLLFSLLLKSNNSNHCKRGWDMLSNPSVITRIAIGKAIGLLVGLMGFFFLPHFLPDADMMLRIGILLWYITFGAIIGVFGVVTFHPVLGINLPWWIRASMLGAWMNFVLVFFAHDAMSAVMASIFSESGALSSPFWFTAEGALIGLLIGYFATRFGGEGASTVGR